MLEFKTLDDELNYSTRNIYVMTYATEEEIVNVLTKHSKQIRAYAYILHDKDNKEPHRHVLIKLFNCSCARVVINWFKKVSSQNTFAEPVKSSVQECFGYLTHENNKSKYQYPEDDIVYGNLEYWTSLIDNDKDDENIALQIVEDLLSGATYYDMTVRYGREWVIYHERYELMACKIRDNYHL